MPNSEPEEFSPELLELYDRYAHGLLDRRGFLAAASRFAAGGLTATALLGLLSPDYAQARQVEPTDERIVTERIEYSSPEGHGPVRGYLVTPSIERGPRPGVVVVHENRGLNPYIEDVARRLGAAGFIALAPDGLTSLGGYPGTDEEGKAMQKTLDKERLVEDFAAAVRYLLFHGGTSEHVGVVGFCFGGWISNTLAARLPELGAAVPFYGRAVDAKDVPQIQAPLLLHFAGNDKRVNEGWPDYQAALDAAGTSYKAHIYPGVNHGFHNDTTPRFDPVAARLAWMRTERFFREQLRA